MTSPLAKIEKIIQDIAPGTANMAESIYLNSVKNEFITFPGRVVIPRISVKELTYDLSVDIVRDLAGYIPEFLAGHRILERRKPAAEVHSLQFAMPLRGRLLDFAHLFKLDFRFGGDSYNIVEKGSTTFYPSYITNRLYFKSRLMPVKAAGNDFDPLRIIDAQYVESDQHFHTFAVFDDMNVRKITKSILEKLDLNVFPISLDLYPFIVYDLFTASLNVLHPTAAALAEAVEIYEPLFVTLFCKYKKIDNLAAPEKIASLFPDELAVDGETPALRAEFVERLKKYFSRYSIHRDDELAVKGWWRIDIAQN